MAAAVFFVALFAATALLRCESYKIDSSEEAQRFQSDEELYQKNAYNSGEDHHPNQKYHGLKMKRVGFITPQDLPHSKEEGTFEMRIVKPLHRHSSSENTGKGREVMNQMGERSYRKSHNSHESQENRNTIYKSQ